MDASRQKSLGQYPTPVWVAEALIEHHFPDLDSGDLVLEPSCGRGNFLQAIPRHVPAVGVEIDALLADEARERTGRTVLTGDFAEVPITFEPTQIIGNPPFSAASIDRFLDRAHTLLPDGGRVGFILPAFIFQTARRVAEYGDKWSLFAEMIPRNIYHELRLPLVFALLTKDQKRIMVGFALYREAADIQALDKAARETLVNASSGVPVWRALVANALEALGGSASLEQVYRHIEGRRPGTNRFWKEKIRQTLYRNPASFTSDGHGGYRLVNQPERLAA